MIALLLAAGLTLHTPDLTCRVRSKDGSLVRSRARVCMFLRMAGYLPPGEKCRVPSGFRVDHRVPLACGGCDVPSNMDLLTKEAWEAKSRWERSPCTAWFDGVNTQYIQAGKGGMETDAARSRHERGN